MLVYRIANNRYIKDLTGLGASRFGGFWNPPGTAILYTSESISLAAWSVYVDLDSTYDLHTFSLAIIEIPDDSFEKTPWDSHSYKLLSEESLRFDLVKRWVSNQNFLCLRVPSEIVAGEFNVLINTQHSLAQKAVRLVDVKPFSFDERVAYKLH